MGPHFALWPGEPTLIRPGDLLSGHLTLSLERAAAWLELRAPLARAEHQEVVLGRPGATCSRMGRALNVSLRCLAVSVLVGDPFSGLVYL